MNNRNQRRKARRDNPYDSPDFKRWADTMREKLIPNMADSANVLMIAPDLETAQFDIEFALQIGACILLEKPLILLAQRGRTIPPKLRAIADRIIESDDLGSPDMNAAEIQDQLQQAFIDFGKQ